MTLIKELIEIPEQVNQGDFVLNLRAGVQRPDETIRTYVVTPQLATAFGNALDFLKSAFDGGGKSKASYLDGSFGSGKSHFMAVLSLLLEGNETARNLEKLQPVAAGHAWSRSKKFLLVPLHLLNAASMEHGILGGYAEFIRSKHPQAPVPAFFHSNEVIANASALRAKLGDEIFFQTLNAGAEGTGDGGGWGGYASTWDAERYQAAASAADPLDDERRRLVSDIVTHLIPVLRNQGDFVPLADGLVAMSMHARDLGYDGVILFLDELVLWLMSKAADPQFVSREHPKIATLVEGKIADAVIPIVSFIARQRDLREALGSTMTGAQQMATSNSMDWWDERFHKIKLDDRNFPVVAQERLLKPKSADAKRQIDEAFQRTAKVRQEVMQVLLTNGGSQDQFRDLYPFSPALVQVLVAVSNVLQRDRTALRLLLQLLCTQRNTLELGQVVPVGDLWDALDDGNQVFAPQMKATMDEARRLWTESIRPLILGELGLPADFDPAVAGGAQRQLVHAYTMRARVAKTLLLSAIAPGVESLRHLTVRRLTALNHGAITSQIPAGEDRQVLTWLKQWQSQIGQIKMSADRDPVVSLELSDVDTDAILRQARDQDNEGNRKSLVQKILFEQLGIAESDGIFQMHNVTWNGIKREIEIRYVNVRTANPDHLISRSDRWVLVIDYPFDDPPFGPAEDISKIRDFLTAHPKGTNTLVWIPHFLSQSSMTDLANLVIINYLLQGQRLDGYTQNLNVTERSEARKQLTTRQDSLKTRVANALAVAYGVTTGESTGMAGAVIPFFQGPGDQVRSLLPGFDPQNHDQYTLQGALEHYCGQAFAHQFPGHFKFTVPVSRTSVKRVAEVVKKAIADPNRRVEGVDRTAREALLGIAVPMELGALNEDVFTLRRVWVDHFIRSIATASDGNATPTVGRLREFCDQPSAKGMTRELTDLVIWTFVNQSDRRFYHNQMPAVVEFDQLDDRMEVREQVLPKDETWKVVVHRLAALTGHTAPSRCSAAAVQHAIAAIKTWVGSHAQAAQGLQMALVESGKALGIPPTGDHPRLAAANQAVELLGRLQRADDDAVIGVLADAKLPADLLPLSVGISTAARVAQALRDASWVNLTNLAKAAGPIGERGRTLLERTQQQIDRTQNDIEIVAALAEVNTQVQALWVEFSKTVKPAVDDDEERRRQQAEAERRRQMEEAETRLREREAEIQRREVEMRQQQEEAARRAARDKAEQVRREVQAPIEIRLGDPSIGAQVAKRLEALRASHPNKTVRITIDVVDG
jgi:hypothetical protein